MIDLKMDQDISARADGRGRAAGIQLPDFARRQIANQLHALVVGRTLNALARRFGDEVWHITEEECYSLGREMAAQIGELLELDVSDARSLTRVVDLCNACLDIVGDEVVREKDEVVRHERECLLSKGLCEQRASHYCASVFQPMYRGVLHGLNAQAGCNDMTCMMSKGDDHCEVVTWIGRDRR
jgi:hypothetical protein